MQDDCSTARERVLQYWERSISDALSHRNPRGLRFLQANITASSATFTGAAKARALATLARCAAARRFLRGGRHVHCG